jgi:hypothetical protein
MTGGAAVTLALFVICVVVLGFIIAVVASTAQSEHLDDQFESCVNAELNCCSNYSDDGRERCFNSATHNCSYVYGVGEK